MIKSLFVKRGGKISLSALKLKESVGKNGGLRSGSQRTSGARLAQLALAVRAASKDAMHIFPATTQAKRERLDLLLGILADVPHYIEDVNVSKDSAKLYYSETVAAQFARAVAVGIHLRLHIAFANGAEAAVKRSHNTTRKRLHTHEQKLRARLASLRRAAQVTDAGAALSMLKTITHDAHHVLPQLVEEAAQVSLRESRKNLALGLEASILARRNAMAAAGCVMLHRRLLLDRLARGTKFAVERIPALRRDVVRPEIARTDLSAIDVGRRFSLLGRASEVEWIGRPQKPYTRVGFVAATVDLHVPQRSLDRRGVTPGTVVWAMGTVKKGPPLYLESEFEGPGQNSRRYFEDYLATLTRPAYDLYPGSMLLEWEFPRIKVARGANDLISRVI